MLRSHRLEQSPPFVRSADSFTSFRSQLKTYNVARHLIAGPPSAPLIPLNRFFARYKFVTYLLTYIHFIHVVIGPRIGIQGIAVRL